MLQKYTGQPNKISHFKKDNIEIQLYTVDKFQGREADVVFISMCRNRGIGFMDNTNRMNVALTRAKYQRVIVGDKALFENQHFSDELRDLSKRSTPFSG
jgi:superfamily I DNA and/or RNA helicase